MIEAEEQKPKALDMSELKTVEPIEESDMKHPLQNKYVPSTQG